MDCESQEPPAQDESVTSLSSDEPTNETTNEPTNEPAATGSSLGAAVFNFTNSIVGAGAIGLGGAISLSGGLVSVICIVFFAVLTKISLDLVIDLSTGGSYEELGKLAYGKAGSTAVLVSKTLYAFGCLIAYIVVVKDNFASALRHLLFGTAQHDDLVLFQLLKSDDLVAMTLSTGVILPLCLLRDMTPLSSLSLISVLAMASIVFIVIYLFVACDDIREPGGNFYENWLQVRPGILESLGTFVFSFVSQHTAHLAYESLSPDIRNIKTWKRVSTLSIGIATTVSLSVGLVVYCTFWQETRSDLFEMYPPLRIIDVAKLLLCITMLLTFPLPFFACREMVIVATKSIYNTFRECTTPSASPVTSETTEVNLEEPLLPTEDPDNQEDDIVVGVEEERNDESQQQPHLLLPSWLLSDRQLKLAGHVILSFKIWLITTSLAIVAPSLGDVLDVVGCATGTVIAFILPALFSFKLRGYSHLAALILIVGGIVGFVGTFYSMRKLLYDLE